MVLFQCNLVNVFKSGDLAAKAACEVAAASALRAFRPSAAAALTFWSWALCSAASSSVFWAAALLAATALAWFCITAAVCDSWASLAAT